MKKYLFVTFLLVGVYGFNTASAQHHYGAKIDEKDAITMEQLVAKMESATELEVKVIGKVSNVCQTKGCWMTLEKGDGSTMRVSFTDYGFFMPKNIAGKTVVIQGRAKIETTTVEELRHYAEDAKKSKEEIAKITEPEKDLAFEADGVIVK